VKGPDVDDYHKLKRVMRYLRGTIGLPLTLEANGTHVLKSWVDASFAVHHDMRSQTGAAISLGKGAVYSSSTCQKINTKSSTESELVGMNNALLQIIWTQYLLEAQGYDIKKNILYQDNKATILLQTSGKWSSMKCTRALNIRYFFIADQVEKGQLTVEYCPTGYMVADLFSKPTKDSCSGR